MGSVARHRTAQSDIPSPTTMPPGRGRELWTEGLGPGEHGPGRDTEATLTEDFGDLPGGEWVAQVPADRADDDLRRPTVAEKAPLEARVKSRWQGWQAKRDGLRDRNHRA